MSGPVWGQWTNPMFCPRGSQGHPTPHWHSYLSCADGRWGYVRYDPATDTVDSQHAPPEVVMYVVNVANDAT